MLHALWKVEYLSLLKLQLLNHVCGMDNAYLHAYFFVTLTWKPVVLGDFDLF